MNNVLTLVTFIIVMIIFIVLLVMMFKWKWIVSKYVNDSLEIMLSDDYQENVLELIPGLRHAGVQPMIENNLRTAAGKLLKRPLGSSKNWPHLDPITFIPAQTSPYPISSDVDIDMSVTIGPQAKKPMRIDIPLMISGMAYGIALSEDARLALAGAATNVGTAINSGEGGVLEEEIEKADKYILQFAKSKWSKDEALLKKATMIEIKLGQGALFSSGEKIGPEQIVGKARQVMGLEDGEDAIIHEKFFENQTLDDMKNLVQELRELTDGVPIGVKMGAGGKIEQDIDHLIYMGVDYIAVDGGQAATMGAPPLLSDDIGIPTLHAIVRASNHLVKRNKKGKITLIASGGLIVPGHFLKVLALGADAVYVGSAMLYSLTHQQLEKAIPFEPPTQLVWDSGQFSEEFDLEKGEKSAENFLRACIEEMEIGMRVIGKQSLQQLSRKDLSSYDEHVAKYVGIPYTFEPWKERS